MTKNGENEAVIWHNQLGPIVNNLENQVIKERPSTKAFATLNWVRGMGQKKVTKTQAVIFFIKLLTLLQKKRR